MVCLLPFFWVMTQLFTLRLFRTLDGDRNAAIDAILGGVDLQLSEDESETTNWFQHDVAHRVLKRLVVECPGTRSFFVCFLRWR